MVIINWLNCFSKSKMHNFLEKSLYMILVVVLAISLILLIGISLFSFNERYKTPLVLFFSATFFLSMIGCVVLNYVDCASGSVVACEAFNNIIIN